MVFTAELVPGAVAPCSLSLAETPGTCLSKMSALTGRERKDSKK